MHAALTRRCAIGRMLHRIRSRQTFPDSCRFELACGQCLDGCDSDLSNVTVDRETLPTCEPIPEGVRPSSAAITLQTFDIQKGYYRTHAESPIVLECYQTGACIGGVNSSNYCAVGYRGPCKSIPKNRWMWSPRNRRVWPTHAVVQTSMM